jgi:hypothetical protein
MTLNLFVSQCDWLRVQAERDLRNSRRELRVHNISCDGYRFYLVAPEDVTTKRATISFVYFAHPLFQIGSYYEQHYCRMKVKFS